MQYNNEDYSSDGMVVPDDNYLGFLLRKSIVNNGLDERSLTNEKLDLIYREYNKLCEILKNTIEVKELDTFKRAACFLLAMDKFSIKMYDLNVALDASLLMCEHPYCFIGEKNIVYKMNTVNFDDLFLDDMDLLVDKVELINNIKIGRVSCLDISEQLELWYYIASMKNGLISRVPVRDESLVLKNNYM